MVLGVKQQAKNVSFNVLFVPFFVCGSSSTYLQAACSISNDRVGRSKLPRFT